jgi:hypothetical protein
VLEFRDGSQATSTGAATTTPKTTIPAF